jgi:acyl-CoA synthetase (AMP-forming)/AMP-acid ligase II
LSLYRALIPLVTQVAAAIAGSLATAAYLDARFLIRRDLRVGSIARNNKNAAKFVAEQFAKDKGLIYDIFEEHALGKNADNIFLIFEDKTWTYRQFYNDVQRVGNWLLKDLKVQRNEMLALDGPNSPEYIMILLAVNAIDACSAYINCNLTATPMVHSVKLCEARYFLTDRLVQHLVQPHEEELKEAGVRTIYFDEIFMASLQDSTPLPASRRKGLQPDAVGRLIYTSGTTGLPKGVRMTRGREIQAGRQVSQYLGLKPGVRMYTCLPLYHVSGHGLCTIPSIYAGSTVVLSRKFSHKTFWPEVRSSKADIVQHVGELLRYMLNAPPSPSDKQHNVRMVWGNGIRPDVWSAFRERFGVETINEIYGATDGHSTTMNMNRGEFGRNAVAVRGPLWRMLNGGGEKRIRIDVDTEEVIRNSDGFAIACKFGEAGELINKVDPKTEDIAFTRYYKNKAADDKKKLRDVFEKGDLWYRSGDLLREDADGCMYFVDRLGDTFRWHSENVSTNEVGEELGAFSQIAEANVYGVQVPHADGRAGCAAITPVEGVTQKTFDFEGLAQHALAKLPRYAVPVFIRIVPAMDLTATMKLQKGRLKTEGVDLEKIRNSNTGDVMYWMPPGQHQYVPYERADWENLWAGKVKL